jgi:hypothetical protein
VDLDHTDVDCNQRRGLAAPRGTSDVSADAHLAVGRQHRLGAVLRGANGYDYPHSDSLWPEVPERLWPTIKHLTDEQIDKITHRNAMRWFRFDPFRYHKKEELTLGALRAKAKAAGVDTTPTSSGDARPVAQGEGRRVTSGDVICQFMEHGKSEASA